MLQLSRLRRALTALFVVAGVAALVLAARVERSDPRLYEDERGYAAAACHLLRDGTLSFAPLGTRRPAPDAYREPAYPALIALAWRISGDPPADWSEIERLPASGGPWRAARRLNGLLLAGAAASAAAAASRLAGGRAGALAFALVAASPALQSQSEQLMSENLAATHLAFAGLCLLALARGERGARLASVVGVGLLPLTRAEGVLLLPLALAVAARAPARRPAPARGRALPLLLLALGLALPSLAWSGRNALRVGHFTLSDRGGLALAVRAELDREVARQGAASAALAWTPLAAARERSLALAPGSSWLDYRPTGPGNFYLRTLRRWQAARAAPGADGLAVDRRFGRDALAGIARAPLVHLRAAVAVALRGLFAERSPDWARPFDLAFGFGLLLAGAMAVAGGGALRRGRAAELAFWAPAWLLFGFHAAATELLPRYAAPLLPFAWTALAVVVAGGAWRSTAPPARAA